MGSEMCIRDRLKTWLIINESKDPGHYNYGLYLIDQFLEDPEEIKTGQPLKIPDGSPIGENFCGFMDYLEFSKSE